MSAEVATPLRERIGYQGLLLGAFSLVATLLLVGGHLLTRDAIAERRQEDLRASLSQVIPASVHDNDLLAEPMQLEQTDGKAVTVYRGMRENQVTALAWELTGQGYAGEIRIMIGVDANGEILGVRVLSHAETPGLGDKIEAARSDWIFGFDGLSLANTPLAQWFVKKDGGRFDSFSGATITPRGVVAAIRQGLEFFEANRGTMLSSRLTIPRAKPESSVANGGHAS